MLTLCHPRLRLLHTQLGGFGSLSILYGALGALRVAFPASGSTFASNAWLASIILAVVFFFANVGPNSTTYVVAMETPEKYVRGCVAGLSAALAKLSAAGAFSMFVLIGDPSSGGNMSYVGGCWALVRWLYSFVAHGARGWLRFVYGACAIACAIGGLVTLACGQVCWWLSWCHRVLVFALWQLMLRYLPVACFAPPQDRTDTTLEHQGSYMRLLGRNNKSGYGGSVTRSHR